MYQVLACIRDEHDLRLVLVAGFICGIACFSSIGLFHRCRRAEARGGWLTLTAAVAGAGVWATHFVAMLAFDPGAPIAFDPVGSVGSLALAIVGMALGFGIALGGARWQMLLGGAVVGLAVSAMHFTGILSVRMQGHVELQWGYVAVAVLLAMTIGAAALLVYREIKGRHGRTGAAMLFVATILSLHFTAMAGLVVVPDPTVAFVGNAVSRPVLAVVVTLVALTLLITPYFLLRIEQLTQRRTLSTLTRSLDAIPGGMAFFDERDRLISWNTAYEDLAAGVGLALREGMPRDDMTRAAGRAGWIPQGGAREVEAMRRLRSWLLDEVVVKDPNGHWFRHKQFPLDGGGGVVTITDITAETALLEALTEAKESAEAASAAKTAFLANMSHEIRTPMNGLLGAAELLGRRPLGLEERDLVDMLQASGRLLNGLLSDVLDLSRLEARAIDLRPEPTDVTALVAEAHRLFAAPATLKGLDLVVDLGEGAAGWVACDPVRLLQVLGNLLNNAIKFTESGRVTLRVERDGDLLTFRVSDTGVGFDELQRERLFQRFFQADASATRAHGGAGLGLAIASELVGLMGGKVSCDSIVGQGSTFVITLNLPTVPAPAIAPASADPADLQLAEDARVLVVDDNETNRRILVTILAAGGIDHAEAADGNEAVETVTRESFSAVLMDLQMPVMDGLEATRRIRALETATGRARTPIFVVSANCLQEHVTASLAAGADGHFAKPVSVAQLLGALAPHVEVARVA